MEHLSTSLGDTRKAADGLVAKMTPGKTATILALKGDLGAGKTAFAQEVGKIVGVTDNMHSPTFVIMKIYDIDFKGFKRLVHIDAYRIEKESELVHLGWEEIIKEPENLVVIEWPENVPGLIPENAQRISLKFVDETSRKIKIHGS